MKFTPRVAVTVALISVLYGTCNWQPAKGADFVDDRASRKLVPLLSPVAPTIDHDSTRITIDTRLGQLENRVKTAFTEGRLSADEADNFKSAIGQIGEAEANYLSVAGKLGPAMSTRLLTSLNRLEKTVNTKLHDRRVAITDISAAENEVQSLINQARQDGRLKESEAEQLQNELKAAKDLESAFGSDGFISYGDALVISMQIDRVISHLGHLLDEPRFNAPTAEQLSKTATSGDGKIGPELSAEIKKEHDDLVSQLLKIKDIKNPVLKAQQELLLAAQFELLTAKVLLAPGEKVVAIAPKARKQQIDFTISDAFVAGKLTPAETHELSAELQGIVNEMGTDANLSNEKTRRLALELERLAGQVNRTFHPAHKSWPGLDPFQAAFEQRVEDALKSSRITADQASGLRADADNLAKREADLRASNGRLDSIEALDIGMRINALSVQLHHDENDRDVTAPDIAALQAEFDHLVAEGVESGKIRGTSRWTDKLNQLSELRSNYEKTVGGLDLRAKLAIADSTAAAITEVQSQIHRDAPFEMPLDLRLDQLGDLVSNAVSTGLITVERGAQYRDGVDTIYSQLSSKRKSDNGLAALDSLAIANDILLISGQLEAELRDAALFAPEIEQRLNNLKVRIGRSVANGRLTVAEANELMLEISRKSTALNTAASAGGGISHGEGLKLSYDVQRLNSKFESLLHSDAVPITDVAHRAMILDNKLANALASGELTVPEAQQFKTSLESVLSSSALYRDTDSGLSYPEALALTIELDQLGAAITQGIHKDAPNRDVDTRETEIQRRIKNLVTNGKLTQKEADALASDLDRIGESEAAFRVSDEGLNYAEALTLTLDLDRLATRIDGLTKSVQKKQ